MGKTELSRIKNGMKVLVELGGEGVSQGGDEWTKEVNLGIVFL